MEVGNGPLVAPPLTASVAVEVLSAISGVAVAVTFEFWVPITTGVEAVWVATLTPGVPDKARAVPVPKSSTSLILGVCPMGVANKLF
jgi:hypothetical protein